jgi:hypothetical protein
MIFVRKMKVRNVIRKYIEIMEHWKDNTEMKLNTAIDALDELIEMT